MKKAITLGLFLGYSLLYSQIQKIEPTFWWTGMKNPELQLLVYGKNIQDLEPEFTTAVPIKEVKKVDNPNYLFITINTENLSPGKLKLNFKKGKKTVYSTHYEFKQRATHSAQRQGFNSSDVMYLIMPDRFANGNSKNDSTSNTVDKANRKDPDGRHGGDIAGIIQHLDYLQNLGVTTIWSTPLLEDNEPRTSYHGYAQSNYYQIDPRYGTNEDYKNLANELHQRKMKLVMDYVTNHWGSESWILKDIPSKDWLNYWDNGKNGFKRSSYRLTTQFDPNASKSDADWCMDGWFDTSMPDMNQKNPLVLNYLTQNAIWWIEYAGLDGLRVDTYPYNDKNGIAQWTKNIMTEYPNFNIVGEIWMHDQAQIAYWQKDSKIGAIENYNSHLPSVMDFTLHNAINQAFKEGEGWDSGMQKVYDNFTNDFLYPDINNILVFMENHDTARFNHLYPDIKDYRLALTLISTVRGIPQLYYGTEIGMTGDKSKGDGDIRKDFPGGWKGDPQNAFTSEGRTKLQNEYHQFTSKLLNWRKNQDVVHKGRTLHYIPENNVYVYFRILDNKRIMVILNNNPETVNLKLDRFQEGLQGFSSGKEVLSDTRIHFGKELTIPGKTPMIIELLEK